MATFDDSRPGLACVVLFDTGEGPYWNWVEAAMGCTLAAGSGCRPMADCRQCTGPCWARAAGQLVYRWRGTSSAA